MVKAAVKGSLYTEVTLKLLKNIAQRGRNSNSLAYGKTEPVSLTVTVIGVLTQNYHSDGFGRCQLERVKNLRPGGGN